MPLFDRPVLPVLLATLGWYRLVERHIQISLTVDLSKCGLGVDATRIDPSPRLCAVNPDVFPFEAQQGRFGLCLD